MQLPEKILQFETVDGRDIFLDLNEAVCRVNNNVNQLIDYLAEREPKATILENDPSSSRSDTYGINTTLPVAYRGEYQKPTTTDTTMKLTPLFKAEDVEIVESWLPTFGTEQLMVYSIHIEFKTKEAAEQAREALLKLTDTH